MGIFSQQPKSFKLDRNSPFAADLKSAISVQLPLFLGPLFDDDILTEYVTVLVCNGKTQNQARDDLDAFLGERSEAFVSWLWDFLLKNEQRCTLATLKDAILACPEDSERRRNTLEVNSEKTGDAATIIQMLDRQKTRNNVLPKVITSSPEIGLLSGGTSPVSDYSRDRQVSGLSKKCPSPTILGSLYCDKVQVSVWDRLSRPSKAALTDGHVDNARKYREGPNDLYSPFLSKSTRSQMRSGEVFHQCKRYQGHAFKHNRMHNFSNNLCGDRFVNDMRRKRNFVQITQSDSRLVGKRYWDNLYNNQWRADKRSKFVAKAPKDLLSTVEDVKLRLQQMEREISLLRSRNIGMGNDPRNNSSMNYGVNESTVEDHESRTVLVTNVHYAAKREALSVFFAKCGRVINVVLLSDLLSFSPDSFVRSAYITFASLESIDKAVNLSGAIFYSRALTVTKYNHKDTLAVAAVSTSPAVSCTGRHVQQSAASYHGTHLLCRRESTSCPAASEQSTPMVTKGEVADFTASGAEQPSSISSRLKDDAGYSSMHNAESVTERTVRGVAGYSSVHIAEPVAEETNMEAEDSAFGDEQPSLIPSPLKDVAGYSNMHNAESVAEKTKMEVEVAASEDEQQSLISSFAGYCNEQHNAESADEKTNDADNVTCVSCLLPEEQQCSDSCGSVKNDDVASYQAQLLTRRFTFC